MLRKKTTRSWLSFIAITLITAGCATAQPSQPTATNAPAPTTAPVVSSAPTTASTNTVSSTSPTSPVSSTAGAILMLVLFIIRW